MSQYTPEQVEECARYAAEHSQVVAAMLRAYAATLRQSADSGRVGDESQIVQQLRGRAAFLRDKGRIKSPEIMERAAAAALEAALAAQGQGEAIGYAKPQDLAKLRGLRGAALGVYVAEQQDEIYSAPIYTHPAPAASPAGVPESPLPMGTAPRDGTMLRLLVRFEEHATDDAEEAWTIGSNSFDANGEDRWQFAGWCWTHDHFTEGKGTPIGWLPMLAAAPSAPEGDGGEG